VKGLINRANQLADEIGRKRDGVLVVRPCLARTLKSRGKILLEATRQRVFKFLHDVSALDLAVSKLNVTVQVMIVYCLTGKSTRVFCGE